MNMSIKMMRSWLLLALLGLALACSGRNSTTMTSKNDDVAVTVRLADKSGYSMSAYLLTGSSLTDPGTLVGEGVHNGSVWSLKLDPTRSYRIRVSSHDVDILDTIVLSSDFAKAQNSVLDIKVINGATTYLTLLAYGKDNADLASAWQQVLTEHGVTSFDDLKLAGIQPKLNADDLEGVRLMTISAGLMTESSSTSDQQAWNNILSSIALYVDTPNSNISGVLQALGELGTTSLDTSDFDDSVGSFLGLASTGTTGDFLLGLLNDNSTFTTNMAKGKAAMEGKASVTSSSGNVKRMDLDDAYAFFSAAKAAEPSSSEALFFTALTRLASMPVRDSAALTKLKDAFHLSMTYHNNDDIDYSTTVLVNPNNYTDLPRPDFLEEGVRDVILQNVEECIADLNAITFLDTREITLTKSMQGDTKASSDVKFDRTDIAAVRAWLQFIKAQAYYGMSHDLTLSGKSDTNVNMRQFILDLNREPQFSGNATYTGTAVITSASGSGFTTTGSVAASYNLLGGFPGELLDGSFGSMKVEKLKNSFYHIYYDFDATLSGLRYDSHLSGTLSSDLATIAGNVNQGVYQASSGNFLGSRNLSLTASLTVGGLSLDSQHNIIYATQYSTLFNNNTAFLTAEQTDLASARISLQSSLDLMNFVLGELKAHKSQDNAARSYNLVDDIDDLTRDDGHAFSVFEISDFQTFLSSLSHSLNDNGATLDPRMFDSDLSASTLDLGFAFDASKPLRHYLTASANTSANTNSKGEVDFNDKRTDLINQYIAGGDDTSALHFFGQNLGDMSEEIGHVGESVVVFVAGLQKPKNVGIYTFNSVKFITWDPVDLATGYNVYYAHEAGVTPSNFQSLNNPGKVFITGGNAFFATMSGNLNLNDTGNGQHYFVVTAVNDTTPLVSDGTTRSVGPAYESVPSAQANDATISSANNTNSKLYYKIIGRPEFNSP